MLKILFIGTFIFTILFGIFVWLQNKTKSEKETRKSKKNPLSSLPTEWRSFIPSWIPAHAWQVTIALIICYGIVRGISPETWKLWFSNRWLFWFLSIGGPVISTFFDVSNRKALVILVLAILFLHTVGAKQTEAGNPFNQRKVTIKNVVMGLPTSPLEVEVPIAPRMLIVDPGIARSKLCYNNDLPMKVYHLNNQGETVALFENVKGQEERAKGRKFPTIQSGWRWGYQAQRNQPVLAEMWAVTREESCD